MTPAPPSEPSRARGSVAIGMKAAAVELWGNDVVLSLSNQLSADARAAIFDGVLLPMDWVAEESILEFWRAAWEGPIAEREGPLASYVEKSVQHGWGRFHKVFVSLMTPALLAERAQKLWRHDHTHGRIEASMRGNSGVVRLVDHDYVRSTVGQRFIAASFHCIVAMSRASDVKSTYKLEERDVLTVRLSWT
jgi:hypothetical protein